VVGAVRTMFILYSVTIVVGIALCVAIGLTGS
jgi:hypothetical protein